MNCADLKNGWIKVPIIHSIGAEAQLACYGGRCLLQLMPQVHSTLRYMEWINKIRDPKEREAKFAAVDHLQEYSSSDPAMTHLKDEVHERITTNTQGG